MIKFSFLLLMVYILYYAGNILYDLFFTKVVTTDKEELEEFSISDFSNEKEDAIIVGIEDVENLNTPQSFTQKEIMPKRSFENEERQDLEKLRQRFESEQDLDDAPHKEPEQKKETPPIKDNRWRDILNLSETMVQLVSNIEGHKVYHSTM